MRSLEISFPATSRENVNQIMRANKNLSWSILRAEHDRFVVKTMLMEDASQQEILDNIVMTLEPDEDWTVTIVAPEAFVSNTYNFGSTDANNQLSADEKTPVSDSAVLREEVYDSVISGTVVNSVYIMLIILSTIVTTIGVNTDDVAVVIGGMVIAPLLGPLMGFALGNTVGDLNLIWRSARTLFTGVLIALLMAGVMGFMMKIDLQSQQLLSRSNLTVNTIIVALAAGAAAGISVTSRISSAFVGVMVAVALLPPTASTALFAVAGETERAIRALFVVLTNIVSVIFACQIVFAARGIAPRGVLFRDMAKTTSRNMLIFWGSILVFLTILIVAYQNG